MSHSLRFIAICFGLAIGLGIMLVVARFGARYTLVTVGSETFALEVPTTPEQLLQGLDGRSSLAADGGMLISLAAPRRLTYSTAHTSFPIDAIYLMADGSVVRIDHLQAAGGEPTTSDTGTPVWTALLLPGGAAERCGVQVGDRLPLYPPEPRKRAVEEPGQPAP